MRQNILDYIEFLKNDDVFLFQNYKNFYFLYDAFIKSDKVSVLFSDINSVFFENYNFCECSENDVFSYVSDFLNFLSADFFYDFNQNVVSGNLVYSDSIHKSQFLAIRDKTTLSLDEYSIDINKTLTIKDCFSMIHEFMHYMINRINMNNTYLKGLINVYDESMAIYIELLFYNYIKNKNLSPDIDYVFKKRFYDAFTQGAFLHDYYDAIKLVCEGKSLDDIRNFFNDDNTFDEFRTMIKNKEKSEYVHFIGTLNALNLFFNKVDICNLVDLINDNRLDEFDKYMYPNFDVSDLVLRLSGFMSLINNSECDIK